VKGTLVLSLELKGTGLAAADLEKMRAAAKKALAGCRVVSPGAAAAALVPARRLPHRRVGGGQGARST